MQKNSSLIDSSRHAFTENRVCFHNVAKVFGLPNVHQPTICLCYNNFNEKIHIMILCSTHFKNVISLGTGAVCFTPWRTDSVGHPPRLFVEKSQDLSRLYAFVKESAFEICLAVRKNCFLGLVLRIFLT